MLSAIFWSAVAKRSDDTALGDLRNSPRAKAASPGFALCRRTPKNAIQHNSSNWVLH
jgi:hypothetical protein